ncbi:MAG: leucine-rich repeat protein, partial [Clostridia bacterium]|nr:leucine-rich repeat protein [Clostridia bacterium]
TEMAPSLFKGTIQLNNISLPSTLVEIKSGAFLGSGITRINTSKVTIIGSSAFSECNRLTIVEIGKELVQVSTDSFYNCPLLQSYVVSQDNEKFCSYQGNMYNKDMTTLKFYANGNSSTLTLPASVTSIDIPTLIYAKNLARIEVDSANTVYSSIDGNLYSKDGTELCYYAVNKEEREFTVPSTVTTIRSYCFMSSDKLERVIINSNVTNIQIGCFYNMAALTEIVNNSGVTLIKDQHYVDCNLLSVIQ